MLIDNIDIFCEVIDNYGDVGVAYRLARELKRIYPNKRVKIYHQSNWRIKSYQKKWWYYCNRL